MIINASYNFHSTHHRLWLPSENNGGGVSWQSIVHRQAIQNTWYVTDIALTPNHCVLSMLLIRARISKSGLMIQQQNTWPGLCFYLLFLLPLTHYDNHSIKVILILLYIFELIFRGLVLPLKTFNLIYVKWFSLSDSNSRYHYLHLHIKLYTDILFYAVIIAWKKPHYPLMCRNPWIWLKWSQFEYFYI